MKFLENLLNDPAKLLLTPYDTLLKWRFSREQIIRVKSLCENEPFLETAGEYFEHEVKFKQIKFRAASLDNITRGGIDVGSVTEIYGEAGSGKTQLCLQLSLSCILPVRNDGLDGKVVYMTTDKHFPITRYVQMANLTKKSLKANKIDFMANTFIAKFNNPDVLRIYIREKLPAQLTEHPEIKLVVIDSIAGIFRIVDDFIERAKMMRWVVNELEKLAGFYNFVIVATNHVTANILGTGTSSNKAALGLTWNKQVTTRLEVQKAPQIFTFEREQARSLRVIYSPRLPVGHAMFRITESGIDSF